MMCCPIQVSNSVSSESTGDGMSRELPCCVNGLLLNDDVMLTCISLSALDAQQLSAPTSMAQDKLTACIGLLSMCTDDRTQDKSSEG